MDATFFKAIPKGICPGDAIELYGEEGCGKTELLVHFCIQCILPNHWKSFDISGKEAKVVFIDTDYKFPLWRVVNILENTLRSVYGNQKQKTSQTADEQSSFNTNEANEFVKSCLERLFLIRCPSSHNLSKTLGSVESLLHENPDICLLVVDSMSAFYWTDRTIGGDTRSQQEFNQREIIRKLKILQQTYHIVVIATKSAIMNPNYQTVSNSVKITQNASVTWKHDEYLSQDWNKYLTYRFVVKKHQDNFIIGNTVYTSALLDDRSCSECRFVVKDSGLEYI